MIAAVARNPAESERKQLATLLSLWDSVALGATRRRRASSAGARSAPTSASASCCAWADSRAPQRRAVFQALRKAALLFYYMLPGPDGGRRSGLGRDRLRRTARHAAPTRRRKALATVAVDGRDMTLECDVVSSAPARAAGRPRRCLPAAGLDVVVLEAGDYYDDADFDGAELGAIRSHVLTRRRRPPRTDQSVGLLAGRLPRRRHRRQLHDVVPDARRRRAPSGPPTACPAFTSERVHAMRSTRSASGSASTRSTTDPATREQKLLRRRPERARLARRLDAARRARLRPGQGTAATAATAAGVGAKQSMVKTWLADAHGAGTRLIVRTAFERVSVQGGSRPGDRRRHRRAASGVSDPLARRGRGLRGDPHARAAQAIRAEQREHRQAPASCTPRPRCSASSTRSSSPGRA